MPREVSQMTEDGAELGDNIFEETMRSAYSRGVALLEKSNSNLGQTQRLVVGPSSSSSIKDFSELPKNAMLLKPVIRQLMDKNPPKGFSPRQLEKVKNSIQTLKEYQGKRAEALRDYLGDLEDELALIEFLTEENKGQ